MCHVSVPTDTLNTCRVCPVVSDYVGCVCMCVSTRTLMRNAKTTQTNYVNNSHTHSRRQVSLVAICRVQSNWNIRYYNVLPAGQSFSHVLPISYVQSNRNIRYSHVSPTMPKSSLLTQYQPRMRHSAQTPAYEPEHKVHQCVASRPASQPTTRQPTSARPARPSAVQTSH